MRGVAGELALRGETRVKAMYHAVERFAEPFEFRKHVLADFRIGKIPWLHVFDLRGESP